MKVLIVDGQGGRVGKLLIEKIKLMEIPCQLVAVGTNSIATAAMLKSGADFGATGENAIVVNSKKADVIIGPLGILSADSLLGEVTPAIATAIGQSDAQRILIPTNRCNNFIVGINKELTLSEMVDLAVDKLKKI